MRVEVTQTCKVYLGGVPHDLTAGQIIKGATAITLLDMRAPVRELDAEPAPDPDAVPDGSAEKVLEWVGDSPERALRALEAEAAGKARRALTDKLEKLAGHQRP